MKQTVNEYHFREAFRQLRPDNFTYEGLGALFEYFEQYEEGIGEEMELDVIAICCDYAQYTYEEAKAEYGDYYEEVKEAEDMEELIEAFSDYTTVIPVSDDSLIIQAF